MTEPAARHARFYLDTPLQAGAELDVPEAMLRHLQAVRLQPGATLTVFNGGGGEHPAELLTMQKRSATIRLGPHQALERESSLQLTLVQAMPSADKMDWVVQKAVELGFTRLQPVWAQRCEGRWDAARAARKLAHWQGIVRSASEQCGRNRLLELALPQPLTSWVPGSQGMRLLLDPHQGQSLRSLAPDRALSLLVGPEGGWTAQELAQLQAAGCVALAAGPRVLRTETAGLAVGAALQAWHGDW